MNVIGDRRIALQQQPAIFRKKQTLGKTGTIFDGNEMGPNNRVVQFAKISQTLWEWVVFLHQQDYHLCFVTSQFKICRFDKRQLLTSRCLVLQLCYKTSIGLVGVQTSKFFQIFSLNEVFVGTEMGKICVGQFLRYFGTLNHPNFLGYFEKQSNQDLLF